MKVVIAQKAGFCMGVRRAVDLTLDMVNQGERELVTFGPLIHNPQVLGVLEDKGVHIMKEIPARQGGSVIIRAHGVPPSQKADLLATGARVIDATCPRVVKVQAIINRYRQEGKATVIIGDKNHAEVVGLMGFAESDVQVVSNDGDVAALQLAKPYIIVSQTTQDNVLFESLSARILARFPEGQVFNTICDSTHKRQQEVRNLCAKVEALVVVGGKASANTQRLGEIAAEMGRAVFMVETEEDLDIPGLRRYDRVGVTAGASTPTWMINRVVKAIEAIPGRDEGRVRTILYRLLRMIMASNLYVGLGGGLLSLTCGWLQGIVPQPRHFLIAFGYLFAMHNFNRFADQQTKIYNDPLLVKFCRRYGKLILTAAVCCLALTLAFVYFQERDSFFLLTAMSVFGILYSINFIPNSLAAVIKVRKLKEIPGSKTILVALAWALVVAVIPALGAGRGLTPVTLSVAFLAMLLVFVRNALFDIFEVQGDRIVGKDTLPVCIGEKRTIAILYGVMYLLMVTLLLLPLVGGMSSAGLAVIPGIVYLLVLVKRYERNLVTQGVWLEFRLESVFVLLFCCVAGYVRVFHS